MIYYDMINTPIRNNDENDEIIGYKKLAALPREQRIPLLYNHKSHSLSWVCHQCIDIWLWAWTSHEDIIADMVYAINFFAQQAVSWNSIARDTLTRFSNHVSTREEMIANNWIENKNNKKVRERFLTGAWNESKIYFDISMQEAYTNALNLLNIKWLPTIVPYIKKKTAEQLNIVLDNSNTKRDDDKY